MTKVFIDGSVGTTGLRIYERMNERKEIELITLDDSVRKDTDARKNAINSADIVFLCLPDSAAIEAAELCENPHTAIIDTSTAHRTANDWTYGFAELSTMREKIANSKRIANPGCHATGFISLVQPLVENGVIKKEANLSCFSITGYSGGGKKMIAEYESEERDALLKSPRQYGISQVHKHLAEMKKICNIENQPVFCPIVADFYSGMEVTVPLFKNEINASINDICDIYKKTYTSKLVHFDENCDENGFIAASAMSGRDDLQITVAGNEDRILLISRFDNLGKGASGAAIQNMNILLGTDETAGLYIGGGI